MSNPIYNAKGEDFLYAADLDPSVTPVDAKRGTLLINISSTPGLFQKQDSGLSTNWTPVGSGGGGMATDFSNAVASANDIDLGGFKIVNLADPTLAQDAATKNYVDTEISNIPAGMTTDFSNALASAIDIDLGTNKLINVADPTNAQDAATKNYVDTEISNIPAGMATDFSNALASAIDIDLGTNKLINVADPTNAQDAATKNYVDTEISNIPAGMATDFSNAVPSAASLNLNNNSLTNVNTLSGTGTNALLISQPYNASSTPLDITTGDGAFPAAMRFTTGSNGSNRADFRFQGGNVSWRAVSNNVYLEWSPLLPTGAGGVGISAPNGNMQFTSVDAISFASGIGSPINLNTAVDTGASTTGSMTFETGENTGTGSSGDINLFTGAANGPLTGAITIETGENTNGDSGNITIETGDASGIRGAIRFDADFYDFDNVATFRRDDDPYPYFWGSTMPTLRLNGRATEAVNAGVFGLYLDSDPNTVQLAIGTRDQTSPNASSTLYILSGNNDGAGQSGDVNVRTGDSLNSQSGSVNITSGSGGTNSGAVTVETGTATNNSSNLFLRTGNAATGNSGNIVFQTGSAPGTRGNVNFACNEINFSSFGSFFKANSSFNSYYGGSLPAFALDGTSSEAISSGAFGLVLRTQSNVEFIIGTSDDLPGQSSPLTMLTGDSSAGSGTGRILVKTGAENGGGPSGNLILETGSANTSGQIFINTGLANLGNSGRITIGTADSNTGNSGDVEILTGNAPGGTKGKVKITNQSQFRVGLINGDPTNLENGEIWYNTVTNELKAYVNGAVVVIQVV
jgi:uncharacterized protein YbaA (DUF1428 family)